MGSQKRELERQQDRQLIAQEIHRRAGNVEDSTDNQLCDNENQDMDNAYQIASAMWRDKNPLVSSFESYRELADAVKNCLNHLPNLTEQNEAHFERF